MYELFLQILFISSAFLFLLNYFIYPLILILFSKIKLDPHQQYTFEDSYSPKISLIIAAYNEEKVIRSKLINSLALSYEAEKIEIIVVSDGSDDNTHNICLEYADRKVKALHEPERRGKSAALNRGASVATGDILIFSDANNDFGKLAVINLVKHFVDDSIGAVTGAKHIYQVQERESTQGDGLYWRYEAVIKRAESHLGSITSGDGEIFAVRKSLFQPIDSSCINDDAAITFDIVKQGYRVLYESESPSYENASTDLVDDFHVKVRMTAGGYQTISRELAYLFPPRTWFTLSFLIHKLLRWLAPVFLILIFVSSVLLSYIPFYLIAFLMQLAFYSLAAYGWFYRKKQPMAIYIYVPMYFTVMNLALFSGLIKHLKGQQKIQWRKAER